jgi:RNA polymerase sigma factor (TIGR02999 family)
LTQWSDGDREAFDRLMPIVYDEMRNLGRRYLATRRGEALLQPTVLIHETWMRLASKDGVELHNRLQFFALSAKIIRDILTDHYRRKHAAKHGGAQVEIPLEAAHAIGSDTRIDFLALNEAIDGLARIKPRYAQIIELRFIAGFTVEETAELLQISDATVEREWTFARLWLRRALTANK